MAAQNEPTFALFTSSDLDFLTDELFAEIKSTNDTLMVSLVMFMSFARVLCNRYDARWISKLKAKILQNGGMVK